MPVATSPTYQTALVRTLSATERCVLDLVWRRGPISRAELAVSTGLTGATVSRTAQRLFELGLMDETVMHEGQRGQPPRSIHIVASAACSVGVYFSHRHLEVGLVDMSGALTGMARHDIQEADPGEIAGITKQFVTDTIRDGRLDLATLAGIGFALPGDFIGHPPRLNAHAYFPKLRDRDLLADFSALLPYPVFVENDAASAALGERSLGVGQSLDSFLFIHIGHGVGGGIVLDGRLWRGANGNAGMIGIQFSNDRPRPSGQDLFGALKAAGLEVDDFTDLETMSPNGCAPLRLWVRRAGQQLREQLSITARLFDPEAIVIGGRLPTHLIQALTAEIDQSGFCDEGQGFTKPRVMASHLGPRSGLVGAACLPILQTYFAGSI